MKKQINNEERFFFKRMAISAVNMESALARIDKSIRDEQFGYICVTNERTTYLAAIQDEAYCRIQNGSLLTVPDGMPLVWIAHNLGYEHVGRVSGLDLLENILNVSGERGYSHYFYGSTPQTIGMIEAKMDSEYPGVSLKGAVSPPFQPLESFDIDALAGELNSLKPTFFWCGLGAPKQEKLIALLQPKLKGTICIGVGLVFEYLADNVTRSPLWAQKMGLEGFYRLYQQPKRISLALVKRYFYWIWIILYTRIFGRMRK